MSDLRGLITLVIVLFLAVTIVAFVFKRAFRLGFVALAILIIGSIGFIWLPQRVEQITSGETTAHEVFSGVVDDYDNSGIPEAIEEGTQTSKTVLQVVWGALKDWYYGQ